MTMMLAYEKLLHKIASEMAPGQPPPEPYGEPILFDRGWTAQALWMYDPIVIEYLYETNCLRVFVVKPMGAPPRVLWTPTTLQWAADVLDRLLEA
jgi:hypothetical protein